MLVPGPAPELFGSCTGDRAQNITVYGRMESYLPFLPAVFCLLGGKRAATYKRMIYELKMACFFIWARKLSVIDRLFFPYCS